MKVLLIANYVPDAQNSMLAFRRVLERELPGTGCEVRALAPPKLLLRLPHPARLAKWLGYLDKFVLFIPGLAKHARWADVVHVADHSNAMYVRWVRARPTVVTCHDVIAVQAALGMIPGWQVGRTGRLFQRLISRGLGEADLVACVSETTRRDLLALRLADESRVTTVLNGLNDDFSPVAPKAVPALLARFPVAAGDRFLLHVGMDLPRKNRSAVVRAFAELQARAAAAGREPVVRELLFVGPELDAESDALLRERGVRDRVHAVQDVSHQELRALYSTATALLFPSLQEGFGWPVIEAQACGCPVFTSDLAPMNEIGSAAAAYVDPHDPKAIARAIEEAAPRLGEMRRLGLVNAAGYSSAQMARNYKAAYGRAIDQRRAVPQ